ncbi:MAG: TetR/AcrR family transcriptional regulator [Acidobacteriota bacterium]|nr:TetR/AcrR family transcriptional regulator [Acidobacteriota bacterium]
MALPEATSPRTERTVRRIFDAAGLCFGELGYSKTTVEEIASRAGVSKALVYVHFDGKEDLLEKVLEATLEEWTSYSESCIDEAGPAVTQRLKAMHRSSIEYAKDHPLLKGIMTRDDRLLLMHVREPGLRAQEAWRDSLIELLTEGIDRGELRCDLDPGRTADVIILLHNAYLDRLFDTTLVNTSDPALVEAGMDALLLGIADSSARSATEGMK